MQPEPPADTGPERDAPLDVERLVFFSDAVVAIAITLLVIGLAVPDSVSTDAELRDALVALGPSLFSFFLSFTVIGLWWVSHHRLLRVVARSHAGLVVLNFVLLASIAFLPFASGVLGHHGSLPTAVVLYALTNLVAASTLVAMRVAAERLGLLVEGVDMTAFRRRTAWSAATAVVFGLSIPIALASPQTATLAWDLVLVLAVLRAWDEGRRTRSPGEPRPDPD